jgi:hypothetical protein
LLLEVGDKTGDSNSTQLKEGRGEGRRAKGGMKVRVQVERGGDEK